MMPYRTTQIIVTDPRSFYLTRSIITFPLLSDLPRTIHTELLLKT